MKKFIPHLIIVLLIIALLFSIERCSYNKKIGNTNAAALIDTTKYFTNKLGTTTASIKTLEFDIMQLQDLVINKNSELKALTSEFAKVKSVIQYKSEFVIDTISVIYNEKVPCEFERTGHVSDKWYSFDYKSTNNGFQIDSLSISNSVSIITGTKRKWFLGEETLTTDITNSNPYIITTNIESAQITIPAPWYKKWYVWLAAGLMSGILIVK